MPRDRQAADPIRDATAGTRRRATGRSRSPRLTKADLGLTPAVMLDLAAVVPDAKALARLTGAQTFTLAVLLAGKSPIAISEAIEALTARGLPASVNRQRLADRMWQSACADSAVYRQDGDLRVAIAAGAQFIARVTALIATVALLRRTSTPPAPTVSRPPTPAPSARESLATAVTTTPPRRTPPVPFVPPALTLAPITPADIVAASERSGSHDLASVAFTLTAHYLASASQFDELLSLASLVGVQSHRYQVETVRRVLRVLRGRALLADEVGLGKTIEALMILREYQLRGMARRVLILVPPALVNHWAGEIQTKAGLSVRTTEDALFRQEPDAFWSADGIIVASLATARSARHAPLIQALAWDLLVVDEAHHVKNRTTLGWKLVDGITSRFVLLITATPIETSLEEIYSLVTLLKPGQFATAAAFRKQFVDPSDPTSLRNRDRLRALLAEVMVRNTRAQSGLRLPPRYVTTVTVDPLDGETEVYSQIVELLRMHAGDPKARMLLATMLLEAGSSPRALWSTIQQVLAARKHADGLLERIEGLARLARGIGATRKADALIQILASHDEQLLVFSRYRNTVEYVSEVLAAAGIAHVGFHGGMTAAAKQRALDEFRSGTRVMLATDVGGEGQNMQFCHNLVNFDLPWNPMVIEQRIGRLHRMGQTSDVRVFNLCARHTAEERVLEVLDGRLHLFELVVGEMDMVLGNMADERTLEDRVMDLYATTKSDTDVARGFDEIATELAAARGHYEKVRALDEQLFGKDYEA